MSEALGRGNAGGRILIVDDYEDARLFVRAALEQAGYAVVEAAHGQHALHYLVSNGEMVNLILLDLMMPVMDGWQFLSLASSYVSLRTIPVLIVSGHPAHLNATNHPSVVGVLNSPYELEDLLTRVNACLSH